MGSTSVKFSGDPQQLLQAYQQVIAANVKLQEQLANTARQSKRDRDAVTTHISREIGSLKSLGMSYLTLSTAVGAVTRAHDEWRQRLSDIAAKAKETNRELVSTIVLAGQAANAGEIAKRLGSIPGVSGGQARAMFEGLTGGANNQASHGRLLSLTEATAPLAAMGIDLKAFGQFVGDMANHETRTAPETLVGRAFQIYTQPGAEKLVGAKMAGPIRKLVASGMSQEEAWALALEANNKGVPGLVGQLAELVANPYEAPDTKGRTRLTPEEAAKTRLASAATPNERRALLMGDEEVGRAAGLDVAGLALLDRDVIATSRRELTSNLTLPQEIARAIAAMPQGTALLNAHEGELRKGARSRAVSEVAKDWAKSEELYEANQIGKGPWGAALSWMNRFVNTYATLGLASPAERLADIDDLLPTFVEERNREAGYRRFTSGGMYTDEAQRRDADALAELTRQTKRLADAMERLRGGGPARVDNNNER